MLWSRAWTTLTSSPSDARGLAAFGMAMVAMAAALIAPPLGLLVLAALAALVLAQGQAPRPIHLDAFAIAGCAALAAAAAAAGLAGVTGVLFVWFVLDATRSHLVRMRALPTAGQPGWGERIALGLAAAFAILLVAASAPHVVMGLPLTLPHPPPLVILAIGLLYALAAVDWVVRVLARWRLGEGRLASAAADAAFHALLLAAFALCQDVSAGLTCLVAYRLAGRIAPQAFVTRWKPG